MTKANTHPLLIRGAQLTENVWAWTLKDHPHTVAGSCPGFEVRVYHYPAAGWYPYLITLVSIKEGWVMDLTVAATAAAAQSEAQRVTSAIQGHFGSVQTARLPKFVTTANVTEQFDAVDG